MVVGDGGVTAPEPSKSSNANVNRAKVGIIPELRKARNVIKSIYSK